ncbi:glucose kinase [Corynebacterium deserti GIMN1.010]|uniref:Glucokinase n=1 Tax=Corynebacterium deserti GIMN1.010 TaxID=931089 RepID=A0A0M4CQU2_9CORY|nr:ROK family glucokinase [Corynebacterium deserti]ALC06367.1 glucose kinase [Corynebacterium deserti GIMN1.010]
MPQTPTNYAVGFDIGGTNMRAGLVDASGHIITSLSAPSPRTTHDMERGIFDLVAELKSQYPVDAVGLAVAGFLDPECETVRFAPHLPWRDEPVRSKLEDLLGLPVRLEHDANSAAWGEHRFGAGQGADNWVLLALGTGMGAALIDNGEIYRGAFGTAPEFGHLRVVRGGRPCSCGKEGCLERYCSGTALVYTARELASHGRFPTSPLRTQITTNPESVTGKMITSAARDGDELGIAVVSDFSEWLGETLSIIADVLDPGMIIIGGGVSRDADLYLDQAIQHYSTRIVGAGHRPLAKIGTAKLGGDAGMIGVADLARRVAV